MAKKKKRWIQGAVSKPGSFKKAAKRAGMSTRAYAQAKKNAPGKTGRRARLALTLMRVGGKRKKKRK